MNKQDRIIVGLLFAALIAWMIFQPRQAPHPRDQQQSVTNATVAVASPPPVLAASSNEPAQPPEPPPAAPEALFAMTNAELNVTVSSWGGAVRDVSLLQFKASQGKDDPVRFDFSASPALSLSHIPGAGTNSSYTLTRQPDGSVVLEISTTSGVTVTRTIALMEGYRLRVTDTFSNRTDHTAAVPGYGVRMGAMTNPTSQASMVGIPDLGLDTMSTNAKASTVHWGGELATFFGLKSSFFGCGGPNSSGAPHAGSRRTDTPLAWAAVKDKFFVQILAPDHGCLYADLNATREREPDATFKVRDVSATLWFAGQELLPGQGLTRASTYYVGPKKYLLLRTFPNRQADVMEFGDWLQWLCKPLLFVLVGLYAVIPNYGIAIILLTGLVRLVFWPLTHKSTESMKKMQELAPLMNELKERYKNDPRKMQQETMMLYKAHGVNPLSGCLPMLVQIPVFFALYVVLRSAVELRYAEFLWIKDLSAPENLFAGHIPLLGSLNILPFLMTATMIWQQKLTPSTADDMQQKIMLGFSVAMMFMFYSLPSALLLYWTVSQGLSIVQLYMQHKAAEKKAAAKAKA